MVKNVYIAFLQVTLVFCLFATNVSARMIMGYDVGSNGTGVTNLAVNVAEIDRYVLDYQSKVGVFSVCAERRGAAKIAGMMKSAGLDTDTVTSIMGDVSYVGLHKRDSWYSNGLEMVWTVMNDAGTKIGSLLAEWSQTIWATTVDTSTVAANAVAITQAISGAIKQRSQDSCGSEVLREGEYFVLFNTYTSGGDCRTTADLNTIAEALERAVIDAANRRLVGWCTSLTNQGTWSVQVKFIHESAATCFGFSDINCPSVAEVIHDEL